MKKITPNQFKFNYEIKLTNINNQNIAITCNEGEYNIEL